jgi:hypothetical protein
MRTPPEAANHPASIAVAPHNRVRYMKLRCMNLSRAIFLCALLGCAGFCGAPVHAQVPEAGSGSSISLPNRIAPSVTLPAFEFHSGFWVNLHHFLYLQARIQSHELTRVGAASANYAAQAATLPANAPGTADWARAVDYYVKTFASRDLWIDLGMGMINDRLGEMDRCPDLSGRSSPSCASGLRPEMIDVLERAANVYRVQWWAAHDGKNRIWIEAMAPQVREMGARLAEPLSDIYRTPWPAQPIRVDLVYYAGAFGSYTTLDPVHIMLSSADASSQGPSGFELLFYEGSHAIGGSVEDAIVRDCHVRGIPIPRDLWHALLFYTTAKMIGRTEAEAPKAAGAHAFNSADAALSHNYAAGLADRGWQGYERVLEIYWQGYLDGKIGFDSAITAVLGNL